jgi:ribonuclease P protein component
MLERRQRPVPTLRRRSQFQRAQEQGRRFRRRHLLLFVVAEAGEGVQLGLTVSRKVGNAVTRNRVRRRLREIGRTQREQLATGCDFVVVALPSAANATFVELFEDLTWLFEHAREWVSSRRSSSGSSTSTV